MSHQSGAWLSRLSPNAVIFLDLLSGSPIASDGFQGSNRMDRIAMLFLAGVGIACICVGYRLFCGLPALGQPSRRASRSVVFLLNIVPGALLALIGAGILTAETRSMIVHRQATRHMQPAAQGTSRHPGLAGYSQKTV
jgi:hypothetical protein